MVQLQKARPRIAPPEPELLPAVIESLLFIAGEPQEIGTVAKSLGVTKKQAESAIDALVATRDGRGVFVQRLGDRVQLATVPDAAPYIEQFLEVEHGTLSRASIEALAIIAYRHPVTRTMIEAVRGVNSDHAVATLEARGLIEEVGRAPGPGRPVLFAPTVRFLQYFGLQRTDDLPPLPDLPDLPPLEMAAAATGELDEQPVEDPASTETIES
jgi:segregation and condensation protein B